jgi:CRP/FNR family transcriptional regulator
MVYRRNGLHVVSSLETLTAIPLFAGLQPKELEWIAQRGQRRRHRAGTALFHRYDVGIGLYIILSGRVKIHYESPSGRDVVLRFLPAGEFLGELSLLDGEQRCASVTTVEATELLVLTREDLVECIREIPQIAYNLLAALSRRVRLTTEMHEAVVTLDAPGRVARQLLLLGREHGVSTDQGVQIALRLTRSDLAGLAGVTPETAIRILSEFRRRGWITWNRQHSITLLRPDKLARRCEE